MIPHLLPLVTALLLVSAPSEADSAPRPDFSGWFENADGLSEALRVASEQSKPLFLYFYTDWCPYCRQFESGLLSTPELDDYVDGIVAVRVNPESGPDEAMLARRYRVYGYPTLYVLNPESRTMMQVERVEVVDGRPVLMTPEAFIGVLESAAGR